MVVRKDIELPPLLPPEGFPPYQVNACKCPRLSLSVREKVERASSTLVSELRREKKRQRVTALPDKWYRSRIHGNGEAPIDLLHQHYAGMGGRSMMGSGVGGFPLGAACPSGGIVILTGITFDLPWFTILLNTFLRDTLQRDKKEEVLRVGCSVPDVFTCWQLNFGKNDSDQMSDTCFYNPHADKNNAKVSSIGTSFGDYEGGGVWVAHPEGDTTVNFEQEVGGIHRGYVPGVVVSQKTRWLAFWAATKVHAIPPFRKNRIGAVAFSSQTGLRCTPEERRLMDILQFMMPTEPDPRFVPVLPETLQVPKSKLYTLTPEQLQIHSEAKKEYDISLQEHLRETDKMTIAINMECFAINRNIILGEPNKMPDGTVGITVKGKVEDDELLRKYENAHDTDIEKIEREAKRCSDMLKEMEKMMNKKSVLKSVETATHLKEMWTNLTEVIETLSVGTKPSDSDTELVDYFVTKDRVSGMKEDQVVSLFPTRPKFNNPARLDRIKMENTRWKHKLKYGTLPPEMDGSSGAATSSHALLDKKGEKYNKNNKNDDNNDNINRTNDEKISKNKDNDNKNNDKLNKNNIGKNAKNNYNDNADISTGDNNDDNNKKINDSINKNTINANKKKNSDDGHGVTNEQKKQAVLDGQNNAIISSEPGLCSNKNEMNGKGMRRSMVSSTTAEKGLLTAASLLMATKTANSRPPKKNAMEGTIWVESGSEGDMTPKDVLFSGAPSAKRPRDNDCLAEGTLKKAKVMGTMLCRPFFPGEIVGVED